MCRVRAQIRFWCPRASTLTASAVGAVPGDRAVVVPVGAHQIGEQFGVPGIGLRPRDLVAVAVAGHRQRVDREHLVAGRAQRFDPQPAVGFDADHHLARLFGMAGHQLVESTDAGQSFWVAVATPA